MTKTAREDLAFNLKVYDTRSEIEAALLSQWETINDNQHDHVRRTRCVNAIEPIVFRLLRQSFFGTCQLSPICKFHQVTSAPSLDGEDHD